MPIFKGLGIVNQKNIVTNQKEIKEVYVGDKKVWSKVNNLWLALGSGTNTIATSPDGINWTGKGSTIFTTYGLGIACSPSPNLYPPR